MSEAKPTSAGAHGSGHRLCPICGKAATVAEYRPFCSKRCADIDLGNWLGERYTVPAVEPPDGFDPESFDPESFDPDAPDDQAGG